MNRIQEKDTGGNTEPWPEIDHIQSINGVNCVDFYKAILLVEGQPIEFIIDTGSPVTIIQPIDNLKNMEATPRCYVDVNKNPKKFKGEAVVEVETERSRVTIPIIIAEKGNTQPLLCLNWLDKLEIGLKGKRETNIIRNIEVIERGEKIFKDYENLFENNHTIKDLTIDIQLKKDAKLIQQNRKPMHFQKMVRKKLEKFIEKRLFEKADKTRENCFISPAVITIKKDKSVKIALDSRKLTNLV